MKIKAKFGWAAFALLAAGLAFTVLPGSVAAQTTKKASSKSSASHSSSTKKKKKRHVARREPTQKAPTADRVTEIQGALQREGFYQGEPSGKWDAGTQDAMRRFQESRGMTGTGKLDASSLQKLGLGSDIAGVSAPRQSSPAEEQAKPAVQSGAPAASASANPSGI